jgi:diguanylate cyclase (GGDEF)-like protein
MTNFREALDSLIKLVSNVTDAFTAALFLPNKTGTGLELTVFHSLSRHIPKDLFIEKGHGLIGWVAQAEQNLNVSEFHWNTKTLLLYSHDESIKSFLAVPVKLQKFTGVLCVDSKKHYIFPPKVEKILTGFAQEFTRILATQKTEDRGNIRDITALLGMGQGLCNNLGKLRLLDLIESFENKIIPYDGLLLGLSSKTDGGYSIVDTAGEGLHKMKGFNVSLSQSLLGWVLRNGSPLKLMELKGYPDKTHIICPNEPRLRINSFLGVPLVADKMILGVLGFLSHKPTCFNDHHLKIASLIATQAAMALAYAILKGERRTHSSLDPSTGIYHFNEFVKILSEKLAQGIDYHLLIIEPDNLEQLRMRYDHTIYEEVARQIAQILLKRAKGEDLVSLSISNGFLLALARTNREVARQQAEAIRTVVEETILLVYNKEIHLTVTIGISPLFPCKNRHQFHEILSKSIASFNDDNHNMVRVKNRVLAGSLFSNLPA